MALNGNHAAGDPGHPEDHNLIDEALQQLQAPNGQPVVRRFPFAYDTPGLATGATVFTPTVGDILLDAWFEITESWDGTTPQGDFGPLTDVEFGMFAKYGAALDMTLLDTPLVGDGVIGGLPSLTQVSVLIQASQVLQATGSLLNWIPYPLNATTRFAPGRFGSAEPLKVVVSQNGTRTGDDPGSTQGSAVLYLVTATPI